jgi:allantoin racemase
MANSFNLAGGMEAQIVPPCSLAFTDQTTDHGSLDGTVIAYIPASALTFRPCILLQENTMSRPRILVINPNSNPVVTRRMEDALKPLGFEGGPEIVCETLTEGPYGIESQADADSVAMPLRRLVESDNRSAAFVIACYSDPGLHVCREGTDRPVFGIAECGVLTALARAETFGVIAIAQRSIRRHMRYLRQMELMTRLAGERPLNMSVAETASGEGTLAKMIEIGRALKDEDGAGAIVMGCAGMARHRRPLEQALGIPVIDPTQAAVTMALGTVQFSGH